MHNLIIIVFVLAIMVGIGFLITTGKLSADALNSKTNNIPTLQDVLKQSDSPLQIATSTVGLLGFQDPSKDNLDNQILTRGMTTEDAIRARVKSILDQVQVSTDSGTGQGINVKTISGQEALSLLGCPNNKNIKIPAGGIKLVTDPTSGLTSIALTQETINRARSDPQLMQALLNAQFKFVPYAGGTA